MAPNYFVDDFRISFTARCLLAMAPATVPDWPSNIAWLAVVSIAGYGALACSLMLAPKLASLHAAMGIGATVALAMMLARTVLANAVAFLGQKSLVIYVAHVIPAAAIRIALQRGLGLQSVFVHLALGTLAGIAGPLLLEQLALYCHFPYLFSWPSRPPRQPESPRIPRPSSLAA